jgi:undecaprenyl diphosphate synthase
VSASGVLPSHVGIIMDGNGRWARERGRPRSDGHLEGLTAAKRVTAAAADLGIRWLTLYTFSTENWTRAEEEVSYLMFLIRTHLKKELDFYRKNRIRILHAGDAARLPPEVTREIRQAMADTAGFDGLTVVLAINYGGRDEIVRAVRRAVADGDAAGVTEETLRAHLDLPEVPDPDLVIRTGAELRHSNFLLWQAAYAELYFSPRLWPDWDRPDLEAALDDYARRSRRFGGAGRAGRSPT